MRVEEHLQQWLRAGVVSAEQAERIRAHEQTAASGGPRHSRVAEALGYVGGTLALVALLVVVEEFWADLEVWAQAGLLGLLTALLLGAGAWIRSSDEPAVARLASVLWFLSAGAFAFLVKVVADDGLEWAHETTTFAVGAGTAVYGGVLWWWRRTALQQLALGAGVLTALVGGLELREGLVDDPFVGVAVWGLGVIWALLSWGEIMVPRRTGFALGALAALGGAQALAVSDFTGWGLALGLMTAAALIAASVAVGEVVLLALGAVGAFAFVAQTVFRYFGDTVGVPLALFIVGLALVALALVIGRVRPHVEEASRG